MNSLLINVKFDVNDHVPYTKLVRHTNLLDQFA